VLNRASRRKGDREPFRDPMKEGCLLDQPKCLPRSCATIPELLLFPSSTKVNDPLALGGCTLNDLSRKNSPRSATFPAEFRAKHQNATQHQMILSTELRSPREAKATIEIAIWSVKDWFLRISGRSIPVGSNLKYSVEMTHGNLCCRQSDWPSDILNSGWSSVPRVHEFPQCPFLES
jgi:hypothetical protein